LHNVPVSQTRNISLEHICHCNYALKILCQQGNLYVISKRKILPVKQCKSFK